MMTSLQNSGFTTNSPARYFSSDTMDDEPILSADSEHFFRPLQTIPVFSLHLLISTVISFIGIILAFEWEDEKRCEAYFIMLYLRGVFWVITFVIDHYVKHQHEKLRMNGYHNFHRATHVHKGIALYVVTLWNVVISVIQTLIQHYYGPDFGKHCVEQWFSPLVYVTLFAVLETVVLALVHQSYIRKVSRFNTSQPLPDAMQGIQHMSGSVGQTQRGADMAELLEKQADLINYLRDRNLKLDQKLMQLNAQVRFVHSSAHSDSA